MLHNYFPEALDRDITQSNPAIQLFGNRLFSDQTVSELLVEFLLVAFSTKRFGKSEVIEDSQLLSPELLERHKKERFQYAPKARLNLKLFSFLGVTRLDARHHTHREHHAKLIVELKERIRTNDFGSKDDIIRTIENLFLGFQGAGSGRNWGAQSFIPVSPVFLAEESIWKESVAAKTDIPSWDYITQKLHSYFDISKHRFLARGGELLYLQVCNALRQPAEKIAAWNKEQEIYLSENECDPQWLHSALDEALGKLMKYCPNSLSQLAEFIDSGLDPQTPQRTDKPNGALRFVNSGWCNAESWREGYLFAVELLRILTANLDVVERIYLLETVCGMQALRTLATQSTKAIEQTPSPMSYPGYRFVVSNPDEERKAIKRLSQQSVKNMEKTIFKALRGSEVQLPQDQEKREKDLKQADKEYGGKMFLSLSKRLGFIVPKRGSGARFVLNEHLIRLLVITTLPTGKSRLTYDTFKEVLERHYGLVFDAKGMERASKSMNGRSTLLPADTDAWLQKMLEASGFLIHLSDSCAMIQNPANHQD